MKAGKALARKLAGHSDLLSDYEERLAKIYDAYSKTGWPITGWKKGGLARLFWRRRYSP